MTHGEAVLGQRVCLDQGCHTVFFICTYWDRGHRYCSAECRQQTATTAAVRHSRHQQSCGIPFVHNKWAE
jgi:hypothetical protein